MKGRTMDSIFLSIRESDALDRRLYRPGIIIVNFHNNCRKQYLLKDYIQSEIHDAFLLPMIVFPSANANNQRAAGNNRIRILISHGSRISHTKFLSYTICRYLYL